MFIKPLRAAKPSVLPDGRVEDFIDEVFGNILDLRECNRRLLEVLYVRQREQGPIIQRIGDIFLNAAVEFRLAYPTYMGHHMAAEKRLKEELETNGAFKYFLEVHFNKGNVALNQLMYDIGLYKEDRAARRTHSVGSQKFLESTL
jgi:hypothetical protein